jgi:hypothetical protein
MYKLWREEACLITTGNLCILSGRDSLELLCEFKKEGHSLWEKRNAYKILVGKSKGNRPLGMPRNMWGIIQN